MREKPVETMGEDHQQEEDDVFGRVTEDLVINILSRLEREEDPSHLAKLSCVCKKLKELTESICWKRVCMKKIPGVICDLSYSAEVPGGWGALQRIGVTCPGMYHAGILLENSDLGLVVSAPEDHLDMHRSDFIGHCCNSETVSPPRSLAGRNSSEAVSPPQALSGRNMYGSDYVGHCCNSEAVSSPESLAGSNSSEAVSPPEALAGRNMYGSDYVGQCCSSEAVSPPHSLGGRNSSEAVLPPQALSGRNMYDSDYVGHCCNSEAVSSPQSLAGSNSSVAVSPSQALAGGSIYDSDYVGHCCNSEAISSPQALAGRDLYGTDFIGHSHNLDIVSSLQELGGRNMCGSVFGKNVCGSGGFGDGNVCGSGGFGDGCFGATGMPNLGLVDDMHYELGLREDVNVANGVREPSAAERLFWNPYSASCVGDNPFEANEGKGNMDDIKDEHDQTDLKRKELESSCLLRGNEKKQKIKVKPHLADGTWNLSREQGNKLLASRFRGDCLYVSDWPGCLHQGEKREYRIFRGIFKNFKNTYVWRNIRDVKAKKTSMNCAFCSAKGTWDMLNAFCLRRSLEYHDDGEPSVRAFVCENGHVAGAWTDRPF